MHVVKNQLRHVQKSIKDDMATNVLILPLISFRIIDLGTIVPTLLMTVHIKGH
jgi:hypothetical protein